MKNKIIDIQDYRSKKTLKEQIKKLDDLQEQYIQNEPDPVIRKGYKNFMRFLKALDKKYGED